VSVEKQIMSKDISKYIFAPNGSYCVNYSPSKGKTYLYFPKVIVASLNGNICV